MKPLEPQRSRPRGQPAATTARAALRTRALAGALCVAVPALAGGAHAREGTPGAADSIYVNADQGTRIRQDGRVEIELRGHVRVTHGQTVIESERARRTGPRGREIIFFYDDVRIRDEGVRMFGEVGEYRRAGRIAELRRNVRIEDDKGTIHAQRARYLRASRILWLWGEVDFQDTKTRVQADSVRYDQSAGLGEAFGHVIATDRESGSEIRGSHGFYDRNTGKTWFDRRPVLVLRDDNGTITRVFAESVESSDETSVIVARGDVRIERGSTVALGDSAFFTREARKLELRGRPVVTRGNSRIEGRDIDLFFGDEDVERLVVRRRARMVEMRADTLLIPEANEVRGDSAVMEFADGELHRAVISGRASSVFVPEDTHPNRISLNEAQADSIVMLFADGEVDEVIFVGNASGTYRFYDGNIDSLRAPHAAVQDTVYGVVRGDTTKFDFRRVAEVVRYSGERILYLTRLNDLHLQQGASVEYQARTLQAGDIVFDADTDILEARERPLLLEGGDRIYGREMGYDMETRDAWVESGATTYDQGYYHGERILRRPDGTLQVVNGSYTTCNLAQPHYRFRSKQMKIYLNDKVIGRPVIVYLGHIPVAYLPFFFNSVDTGRRSGFLQPDFEFGIGGRSRYIRGLDYYWAASDHWDVLFSSEYNERDRVDRSSVAAVLGDTAASRNIRLSANLRYKVRYKLDGNLRYTRSDDLTSNSSFVTLGGTHNQTLGERTTLRGSLDFASSDQAVRVVNENRNFDRARQRQLQSNLTLSHRGDLASINLSLRRTQIVNPDDSFVDRPVISKTLPALNLTFRSIRLAPRPRRRERASAWQRFLSDLQFAPNLSLTRQVREVRRRRRFDLQTGEVLPDTSTVADSLTRTEFFEESLSSLAAATGLSLSRQSNLWIFNVTPSVSYSERYAQDDGAPEGTELRKGFFSRSIRSSVAAATTFYGIFRPHLGRLRALRHTIEPRATFSYAPRLGNTPEQRFLSLSLRNQLDMKYDKEGKEQRSDGLVDWTLNASYNPLATTRPWSNVNSSLTLNRQGPVRLTVSQVYDPYAGKILSTAIPFAFRLSGRFKGFQAAEDREELNLVAQEEGVHATPDSLGPADRWGFDPRERDALETVDTVPVGDAEGALGWDLSLGYSLRRVNGRNTTSNVAVRFAIQPTRKWQISYRANFDARTHELTNPVIRVERDLHCWKASFSRVYSGFQREWRYYFRLYVVQHQDDLFYESGDRQYGF